jgi:adenylylsulfate kinase-like enzyme
VPIILNGCDLNSTDKNIIHGVPENVSGLNINRLATLFKSQGNVVIVSPVLPCEEIKNELRKANTQFIEVSVSTDVSIYSKKRQRAESKFKLSGETKLSGAERETPIVIHNAHIVFDVNGHSMDESINKIFRLLRG